MPAVQRFLLCAAAVWTVGTGAAQTQGLVPVRRNWGGLYAMVSPPSGPFAQHAGVGGGIGTYGVACLEGDRVLGIRVELSGTALGGPEYAIRYGAPGAPDVNEVVSYFSGILALSVGPQITLPGRYVRPYVTAQVGLSYVFSAWERRWEDAEPSVNPLDIGLGPHEFNLPIGAGGGILIQLRRGADPLWLDLSAQWTRHGQATIVSDAGITDATQGAAVQPVKSLMSLWQFRVGIVGAY